MRWIALMVALLLAASPLFAVKLKLRAEEAEFEATVESFDGETVVYRKGRREFTAKLDDFEYASGFEIKKQFTPDTGSAKLELARWALHRGLYVPAHDTAAEAAKLDEKLASHAQRVQNSARYLQADALLDKGNAALDSKNVEEARKLFTQVIELFPETPARTKAEVLLGTLDRVALELKARELEEAARKAQEDADADERKKRKPIDDWLSEQEAVVSSNAETKREADTECAFGRIHKGLPLYESAVKSLENVRKLLANNRHHYTYRGQIEQANTIDQAAKNMMIDIYERWVFYLYRGARYDVASQVCNTALKLAPSDRRLLSLKVDIDEMYDPLQK